MTPRPALLLLALALYGCAAPGIEGRVVGRTPEGAPIVQIPLQLSNAYLVKAKVPVLVDTGTLGDMEDLRHALAANGVWPGRIRLIVVTHAHADHAGLAAPLREASLAPIVLGAGDVAAAGRGHNDPLVPTGLTGTLLRPLIPGIFPEFVPDLRVGEPLSLLPWGIDGRVVQMPGHTPGSVVVILANHTAFVGDMLAGGALGGALFPHSPHEHYYQADRARNRQNLRTLLEMGIETFYLGHGGPVSRADVMKMAD
jgi:glyoxylase-like metal-dependent hydrolase (beta-lactamase superfamily II)